MISKAYPKYKPSGVAWLGDLPEHWEVKKLKYSLTLKTQKALTDKNPIALENIEGWTGRFIETESEFEGDGIAFNSGDILFGKLRPYLAKVYLAEEAGESIGDIFVLEPTSRVLPRFGAECLRTKNYIEIIDGSTYGSKMPRASWDFMGGLPFPLPTLPEQEAIASFLDLETGRIDSLIAKKERLLELLAEQRTALISRAVTKGLDATVKLKPSGVAWLGDIPEHWEVKRLKYQVTINDETLPETTDPDYELLYVDISSVSPSKGITQKEQMVFENAPSRARRNVKDGDTIVSTVRTYLRAISPVIDPEENLIVSTGFAVIRPRKMNKDYLSAAIRAPYFIEEVVSRSVGVSYPAINASEIGLISIPLPPPSEQEAIAAFLDRETAKIDTLSAKVTTVIDRLKEYRTALISSAVTGKIDVSTWVKSGELQEASHEK